jgi:acyl carrier protein
MDATYGAAGEADYCAANAFLDAFAHMKNAGGNGPRFIAVNWTTWQEVGMMAELEVPAHLLRWKEENLRLGIHPSEGLEVVRRILANPTSQVLVAPLDLSVLLNLVGGQSKPETNEPATAPAEPASDQASKPASHDERPEMQASFTPPQSEIERWLVKTWQDLIGVEPIGIHDNFFELGGHSLLATRILSRIRDHYKIELPLRVIFEANTVAELGKRIEAVAWLGGGQPPVDAASQDREEITL